MTLCWRIFEVLDDEARRTIGSWDGWDSSFAALADTGPVTEIHRLLTSAQSLIIQPGLRATQSNLLELPQHNQASRPKGMDDIKISPLLAIMLRGYSVWYDDESFAASNKVALALTYALRSRNWPSVYPAVRTAAWDSAKTEADTEFYNLASAAAISKDRLRDTKRGFLVEEAMTDTLVKLDWHLMTDKTRAPVIQMLWDTWLNETQQTIKTLESSRERPPKNRWQGSFRSRLSKKGIPLDQCRTELRLFSRRSASIVLA